MVDDCPVDKHGDDLAQGDPEDRNAVDGDAPSIAGPGGESGVDLGEISERIASVTAKVPEIGDAWRWYDFPYRLLKWVLWGQHRVRLPWRVQVLFLRWLNYFHPFNEHDRNRVEPRDDRMQNMLLPEGEAVEHGGIWVVEFFPPSRYDQLRKSLRHAGWDRDDLTRAAPGSNLDLLDVARTGHGPAWWRLGDVAAPGGGDSGFRAVREVLPPEFSRVEVTAIQVGEGLTAVVAFFLFSDAGTHALDLEWKRDHEPALRFRGARRALAINRHFAAIEATRRERQRIGDAARDWLGRKLPGYFAEQPDRQPVVELILLADFDHEKDHLDRKFSSSLRALGLDEPFVRITSPELPGLLLIPADGSGPHDEVLRNSWGLTGKLDRVVELVQEPGTGWTASTAGHVAHVLDKSVRQFLLYAGVTEYVRDLRVTQARARDLGASRHGRFRPRALKRLRRELLKDGLDLPHVARDTGYLWKGWFRSLVPFHLHEQLDQRYAIKPVAERDMLKQLGKNRERLFRELMNDSLSYREVMAVTASIGASIETSRLGRLALWVSVGSLVVAGVTLLMASTQGPSLWSSLIAWWAAR